MPALKPNPRTVYIATKIPPVIKELFEKIRDRHRVTDATLLYYLMMRGMQAYAADGVLFEHDNDEEWIKSLLQSTERRLVKTGTRR